jgi:hypothetical protein
LLQAHMCIKALTLSRRLNPSNKPYSNNYVHELSW